ncbi:MAG: hypothetical protein H6R14_979 [Proteobacteria bacterium]|nr:hypothetical protein [Pseudomonadota bacterium]
MNQRPEERWRQRIEVSPRFALDVAGDEFRRVLEHVDEAMQLAQHIVGNVTGGARFAVQEDGNLGIAVADFADESAQFGQRFFRLERQLLVVDRQDEGRRPALLLGKRSQVTITGHPQHFHAFLLDGLGQRPDTQTGRVLGTEVFVDDDDGKMEAHVGSLKCGDPPQRVTG